MKFDYMVRQVKGDAEMEVHAVYTLNDGREVIHMTFTDELDIKHNIWLYKFKDKILDVDISTAYEGKGYELIKKEEYSDRFAKRIIKNFKRYGIEVEVEVEEEVGYNRETEVTIIFLKDYSYFTYNTYFETLKLYSGEFKGNDLERYIAILKETWGR